MTDQLICGANHEAWLHWHFHPDTEVTIAADGRIVAQWGSVRVTLSVSGCETQPIVLRGDNDGPAGWYSPSFDVKLPSTSVRWIVPIRGDNTLISKFEVCFEQC